MPAGDFNMPMCQFCPHHSFCQNQTTPVKCDVCGSTAHDHTEMQCQLNRQLHQFKAKSEPDRGES